ncbi:hypothetical protein TNCV_1694261 [Trichonephila clavipes]|nr:hypothetical protein TNCV_1694261 [Trichonephila clavipes]
MTCLNSHIVPLAKVSKPGNPTLISTFDLCLFSRQRGDRRSSSANFRLQTPPHEGGFDRMFYKALHPGIENKVFCEHELLLRESCLICSSSSSESDECSSRFFAGTASSEESSVIRY